MGSSSARQENRNRRNVYVGRLRPLFEISIQQNDGCGCQQPVRFANEDHALLNCNPSEEAISSKGLTGSSTLLFREQVSGIIFLREEGVGVSDCSFLLLGRDGSAWGSFQEYAHKYDL